MSKPEAWQPPTYRWKLWYEGDITFSSEDGEPWESPELGLLIITQPGSDYNKLEGENHYIYRSDMGKWTKHDDRGIEDQQTRYARFITCYRRGWWWFDRFGFEALRKRAMYEMTGK